MKKSYNSSCSGAQQLRRVRCLFRGWLCFCPIRLQPLPWPLGTPKVLLMMTSLPYPPHPHSRYSPAKLWKNSPVFSKVRGLACLPFSPLLPLLRNLIIQENDCETPICLQPSSGLFLPPPPPPWSPCLSAGGRRISIY